MKWDTAWLIKQKLMEAMRQRNSIYKLDGDVQIDDAYLGGEQPEKPGKAGRGAANKIPFVVAVATRDGKPTYTQLRRVAGFTKEAIRDYAVANIRRGSYVFSDGLGCFLGLADAGMRHVPVLTGGGRPKNTIFKWVNIGLGNIKSAITGTCRSFDGQHTPATSPPTNGASTVASTCARTSNDWPASPSPTRPSLTARLPWSERERR